MERLKIYRVLKIFTKFGKRLDSKFSSRSYLDFLLESLSIFSLLNRQSLASSRTRKFKWRHQFCFSIRIYMFK